MTASEIIELLGGSSVVARYAGWPVTTVNSWAHNGNIPEWRRASLLRMAMEQGKALSTADFADKARRAA